MPYTPTTWTEGVTKLGPTNMNHLETGVSGATTTADAAIAKPASPASNDGLVWNGSTWVNAKLVNANIDPAAAIAYSKLSLAGGIVNNDINAAAAIVASKLSGYPNDVTKVLKGDGTWAAVSGAAGTELDYKQITTSVTGITTSTEGTATSIIAGNSITYDGTRNKVEFWCPGVNNGNGPIATFVILRDSTVLGQAHSTAVAGITDFAVYLAVFDTPSAAAHTYTVKAFGNGNSFDVQAGAGGTGVLLPAFLRVTKA